MKIKGETITALPLSAKPTNWAAVEGDEGVLTPL